MSRRRRIPSFVWTLLVGAVLFVLGTAIFFWTSSAPDGHMERLPWIGQLVVHVVRSSMGRVLLVAALAFLAVLQLLSWLESQPQR